MCYDLHITRTKNWDGFEGEHGPEISLDANEADVMEQERTVSNDDDDYR